MINLKHFVQQKKRRKDNAGEKVVGGSDREEWKGIICEKMEEGKGARVGGWR